MKPEEHLAATVNLIYWYSKGAPEISGLRLSSSFRFDDNGSEMGLDDFVLTVKAFAGFADVKLIATTSSDGSVAALFDATDIVTGLRYRSAWMALFDLNDECTILYSVSNMLPEMTLSRGP